MNRKKRLYSLILSVSILAVPLTTSSLYAQATPKKSLPSISTSHPLINQISPEVVRLSNQYGIYASVMLAQTILESNYGNSGLSQAPIYNLFGMKGKYNGQGATFQTKEYKDSGTYQIRSTFKKYTSYTESLEDYAKLIRNGLTYSPNYYAGAWKENTKSYRDATAILAGRYASDLSYSKKLNQIIERYDLTKFDRLKSTAVAGETETTANAKPESILDSAEVKEQNGQQVVPTQRIIYTPTKYYRVKKGDSLTSIAARHGITTAQLKKWNSLTHATIQIKQKLVVDVRGNKKNLAQKNTPLRYVIQQGDSLSSIAAKYQTTEQNLLILNQLDSSFVYEGQIIYLQPLK